MTTAKFLTDGPLTAFVRRLISRGGVPEVITCTPESITGEGKGPRLCFFVFRERMFHSLEVLLFPDTSKPDEDAAGVLLTDFWKVKRQNRFWQLWMRATTIPNRDIWQRVRILEQSGMLPKFAGLKP